MQNLTLQNLSRRSFVVAVATAGGGLLLGCGFGESRRAASSGHESASASGATPPAFAPNAFVRIGADNTITVILPQAEMGQGVYTALPMLVAEELEVGLDQVKVEHAPGSDRSIRTRSSGFRRQGDRRPYAATTSRCVRRERPLAPC